MLLPFCVLAAFAGNVFGQAIGSITGVVQDVSGARIPGVSVTVTSEGEVEVDGKAVSEAQLPLALKEALDKAKEKIVILRGDKKVLLGKAVNILDLAQEAGAKGIALATKPPRPGES